MRLWALRLLGFNWRGDQIVEPGKLLSVSQFALACGYTSQGIRKAIKEKRVRAHRIGKQYVLKAEDISVFKATRVKPKSIRVKRGRKK